MVRPGGLLTRVSAESQVVLSVGSPVFRMSFAVPASAPAG
jgi:hypothetical protein